MGFFDAMGKMIAGKPVFEAEQTSADSGQHGEEVRDGARYDENDHKVVAVAEVTRVETHESGANMELWATIENQSNFAIFLDKIVLLGQTTQLDREMRAGESREYRVYRGPQLTHDNYPTAELYYRDEASRDYFLAYHQIMYGSDGKGDYDVRDLKLIRPIKDI